MERITSFDNLGEIKENQIIFAGDAPKVTGTVDVKFRGRNNLLFIEEGVTLHDSEIQFGGDNALIYLSSGKNSVHVNLVAYTETVIYLGRGNYYNGRFSASAAERQNIIVGNNGLFSWGIFLRTADTHLIYDVETKNRVNPSASVLIGDHVWIGQNSLVLKGSQIGSGAIIGANTVSAGKINPSNSVMAGNPGRVVKHGVFFTNDSVHNWNEEQTVANHTLNKRDWVFAQDLETVNWDAVDARIKAAGDAHSKLDVLRQEIVSNQAKNRFFLSPELNPKVVRGSAETIIVKEISRGLSFPLINPNLFVHPKVKKLELKLKRIARKISIGFKT